MRFFEKIADFSLKNRATIENRGSATEGDFLVVKNDFLGFIFSFWSCCEDAVSTESEYPSTLKKTPP